MRNQEFDNEILNLMKTSPKGYANVIKNNKEKIYLLNYILSETGILDNENLNISTRIYWLLNDITEFPRCKICGKELQHKNINPLVGLSKYCSAKCKMKSVEIKNKIKKTNLERYGVENVFSSKEVCDKIKETNLKRFGFENPNKSEHVKEKIANTNLEKYGVRSFLQTEKCRNRYEEYISNESNRKHIIKKMKETSIEKYGFNSIDKFNGWKTILSWKDYIVPLFDKDEFNNCGSSYEHVFKWKCVKCGNEFKSKIYKTAHIDEFPSLPRCLICYPYMSGFSKKEKEVLEYVKTIYSGEIIENDRTILTPNKENNWKKNHELDIYLPNLKIAIEFNGTYFHSDEESKRNDMFKKIQCKEKGIKLFTIFEDDWDNDRDSIKENLKNNIE